ncbi:MAG: DUF5915 domain-containing protein, partial [Pseudonocardiaceae bacterium]
MEAFDSAGAGRRLMTFIEGLSNWYVRRSRRRFWAGEVSALATLHECLEVLTRLMAPFVPFVTDHLWHQLCVSVTPGAVDSVHLASWPTADEILIDDRLVAAMNLVQRVVELGRATRASSKIRVRQPLARAMVIAPGFTELPAELVAQIAEELNVNVVEPLTGDLVDVTVKPNYRAIGARFGPRTQHVARAVADAGPPVDGRLTVVVDGEEITLTAAELIITETARPGWAVTTDARMSVALDLQLTDELRRAGLVRDILRLVQDSRKTIGLDITDRIDVWWTAERDDVADAIRTHSATVADEILAVSLLEGTPPEEVPAQVY